MLSASAEATSRAAGHGYYFDDECDADAPRATITKAELRRALTRLGPRPLGNSQVDEIVEIVDVASCLASNGAVDIQTFASILGSEKDFDDAPSPNGACWRCCRKRGRRRRTLKDGSRGDVEVQQVEKSDEPAPDVDV